MVEANGERGPHGWFKGGPRSYAPLLKSRAVDLLAKSYPPGAVPGHLYQLEHFLALNKVGPEELLGWSDDDIKKALRAAVLEKDSEGRFAAARRLFYVVTRFLELQNRVIPFSRTERKQLFKRRPKKIAQQHIPSKEEIYRMADAFPDKGPRQKARGKALVLCLWQSGVRASCLCSWTYGMFEEQLYPLVEVPVKIKVVAYREEGVTDCAEDRKLSGYNVDYYWTFLHKEAAEALKAYIEARKAEGWAPKPGDRVFVTHGTASDGDLLTAQHLVQIVKSAAKQIGIAPESVWTHVLRKSFRKTLYRSGVEPDVAEALMGHKLGASRGSYFDYHDPRFAAEQYRRGDWERITYDTVLSHAEKLAALERENQELKARLNGFTMDNAQITELLRRIERLEKGSKK